MTGDVSKKDVMRDSSRDERRVETRDERCDDERCDESHDERRGQSCYKRPVNPETRSTMDLQRKREPSQNTAPAQQNHV